MVQKRLKQFLQLAAKYNETKNPKIMIIIRKLIYSTYYWMYKGDIYG